MSTTQLPADARLTKAVPPAYRRWLTQQEAAAYLGVTDRTIRNLIRSGQIRGYRLGSRTVRVDARELDAALRPIPAVGGDAA